MKKRLIAVVMALLLGLMLACNDGIGVETGFGKCVSSGQTRAFCQENYGGK